MTSNIAHLNGLIVISDSDAFSPFACALWASWWGRSILRAISLDPSLWLLLAAHLRHEDLENPILCSEWCYILKSKSDSAKYTKDVTPFYHKGLNFIPMSCLNNIKSTEEPCQRVGCSCVHASIASFVRPLFSTTAETEVWWTLVTCKSKTFIYILHSVFSGWLSQKIKPSVIASHNLISIHLYVWCFRNNI